LYLPLESLGVHSPRLAANSSYRRKPVSRKPDWIPCQARNDGQGYRRYPVACCGVVHLPHLRRVRRFHLWGFRFRLVEGAYPRSPALDGRVGSQNGIPTLRVKKRDARHKKQAPGPLGLTCSNQTEKRTNLSFRNLEVLPMTRASIGREGELQTSGLGVAISYGNILQVRQESLSLRGRCG
jgi:hypothetical protein